jgi:hypothetical protein
MNMAATPLKPVSDYEEKVLVVMNWLADQSDFAVKGQIRIIPREYPYTKPTWHEAERIMLQLQEQNCVKITSAALFHDILTEIKSGDPRDVELLPPFERKQQDLSDRWNYQEAQRQPERDKALQVALAQIDKTFGAGKQTEKSAAKSSETPKPAHRLKVTYSTTSGEVRLNDLFLLGKPKLGSETQKVFAHLYQHPNTQHSRASLEAAGITYSQAPSHIIRDLGFVGDLAKVFFTASEHGFIFRNPITDHTLKELGLTSIRLRTKNSE